VRLANKTALITGAANGLGEGIALKFAQEGANLVVNDLSFLAAEDIAEKIKGIKKKAVPIQADVTKADEVARMFEEAVSAFGRVDILVNNAGVRRDSDIHAMTEDQWDQVVETQMKGCFNCVQQAQKYMTRESYGKIIIIASPVPSGLGEPGQVNYSAANAALAGMTVPLAMELGKYNINVNCIAPDFIVTQMTRDHVRNHDMFLDDYKKAVLAHIPLRRMGKVEDVAGVAAFLASEESSFVSGQVIGVKGGP